MFKTRQITSFLIIVSREIFITAEREMKGI